MRAQPRLATLRTPVNIVWLGLVAATLLSFHVAPADGKTPGHALAGTLVLTIAFLKVRLIGRYFMELRTSPRLLRGLFDLYCVSVLTVLLAMYLTA